MSRWDGAKSGSSDVSWYQQVCGVVASWRFKWPRPCWSMHTNVRGVASSRTSLSINAPFGYLCAIHYTKPCADPPYTTEHSTVDRPLAKSFSGVLTPPHLFPLSLYSINAAQPFLCFSIFLAPSVPAPTCSFMHPCRGNHCTTSHAKTNSKQPAPRSPAAIAAYQLHDNRKTEQRRTGTSKGATNYLSTHAHWSRPRWLAEACLLRASCAVSFKPSEETTLRTYPLKKGLRYPHDPSPEKTNVGCCVVHAPGLLHLRTKRLPLHRSYQFSTCGSTGHLPPARASAKVSYTGHTAPHTSHLSTEKRQNKSKITQRTREAPCICTPTYRYKLPSPLPSCNPCCSYRPCSCSCPSRAYTMA